MYGNDSCDCNRHSMFTEAGGHTFTVTEMMSLKCSDWKYLIPYIITEDGEFIEID